MIFVYILRCADGSLYIGHTENLRARIHRHNSGAATTFTAPRRPVRVVDSDTFPSLTAATNRERQLKRWTRAKKAALIAGNLEALKRL